MPLSDTNKHKCGKGTHITFKHKVKHAFFKADNVRMPVLQAIDKPLRCALDSFVSFNHSQIPFDV